MTPPNFLDGASRHSQFETVRAPLICFSHLSWDFVYQRPQHLMTRFARDRRVYYVEEPRFDAGPARCDIAIRENGIRVVTPSLPADLSEEARNSTLVFLMDELIRRDGIGRFVAWYYTPMALPWTRQLRPDTVVYDCMDELSLFRGAPSEMVERERELLSLADVVLTGGASLYEAKRARASNVHCFPSSVDTAHFARARSLIDEPADQAPIPHPRLGFAGVIDERMDVDLLDDLATLRPDWHIVMIGPVVKIDPAQLPRRSNIHYLGARPYSSLPAYMSGWDIGLLPFALNEATRYISPTKTPEYLSAGLPVVSTAIRDVVTPYGVNGLARIADTAQEFVEAVEQELGRSPAERQQRIDRTDRFLSTMSWDRTQKEMEALIKPVGRALDPEYALDDVELPATADVMRVDVPSSRVRSRTHTSSLASSHTGASSTPYDDTPAEI